MASVTVYPVEGTSAIAMRGQSNLRLVYDRRQSTPSGKRRGASPSPSYGRLIVVVFVSIMIAGALSAAMSNYRRSRIRTTIESNPIETITVAPGDTLWSLADSHAVDGVSTQDVVDWIKESNNLQSSALRPGQSLVAPVA